MTFNRNAHGRFAPPITIMVVVLFGYAIGLLMNPQWVFFNIMTANHPLSCGHQVAAIRHEEPTRQQIKFIGDFAGLLNEGAQSSTGEYKMGESTDPIKTHIWQEDGTLAGRYEVCGSEGYTFSGSLEQDGDASKNEVSFKWHDRYGTGRLKLCFDDSKGFHGQWKRDDDVNSTWRRWDGQPVDRQPSIILIK